VPTSERLPTSSDPPPIVKVGMGELEVLEGVGLMKTLLGSCIGLVLHDRLKKVGGLAHIVLPTSTGMATAAGKYADTAIPELLRRIERLGGRSRHVVAKLAGGANMFASGNANGIGEQNIAMVESLLKLADISVIGRHCGGQHGRRMAYDVASGQVTVEIVGGQPVVL
jgi:chemotaxis protein CheD